MTWLESGERAAHAALRRFLLHRLPIFAEQRNDPTNRSASSDLCVRACVCACVRYSTVRCVCFFNGVTCTSTVRACVRANDRGVMTRRIDCRSSLSLPLGSSPYLHFGQIAPARVLLELMRVSQRGPKHFFVDDRTTGNDLSSSSLLSLLLMLFVVALLFLLWLLSLVLLLSLLWPLLTTAHTCTHVPRSAGVRGGGARAPRAV